MKKTSCPSPDTPGIPSNVHITSYCGMEVEGSSAFIDRTIEALTLLRATTFFQDIRPYLRAICEATRSGMAANRSRPTFLVGKRTWQSPILWYASTILHDGYHSKLYYQHQRRILGLSFTKPSAWTGTEAERECLRFQLGFLQAEAADETLLKHVETLMADPHYHLLRDRDW